MVPQKVNSVVPKIRTLALHLGTCFWTPSRFSPFLTRLAAHLYPFVLLENETVPYEGCRVRLIGEHGRSSVSCVYVDA